MKKFMPGTRIELIKCDDPWSKLKPGDQGVINDIDGIGTVHINWDSGSRLGLIPGEDLWKTIENK